MPQSGASTAPGDVSAYRLMLAIRRFEEKLGQLVALGVLTETEPLSTGREAVVAGLVAAMPRGMFLASSTATYGVLLAKGMGKDELCARALAGDVTAPEPAAGVLVSRSAAAAVAAAVAKASQGVPALCWVDSTNPDNADLAATVRRAAEGKLPLVLVASATTETALPALEADIVDGMDAHPVRAALDRAIDLIGRGAGPAVLVVRTVPFRGHANQATRGASAGSREDWDCLARARARLAAAGTSESELKALEKSVREEVSSAATAARAAGPKVRSVG